MIPLTPPFEVGSIGPDLFNLLIFKQFLMSLNINAIGPRALGNVHEKSLRTFGPRFVAKKWNFVGIIMILQCHFSPQMGARSGILFYFICGDPTPI